MPNRMGRRKREERLTTHLFARRSSFSSLSSFRPFPFNNLANVRKARSQTPGTFAAFARNAMREDWLKMSRKRSRWIVIFYFCKNCDCLRIVAQIRKCLANFVNVRSIRKYCTRYICRIDSQMQCEFIWVGTWYLNLSKNIKLFNSMFIQKQIRQIRSTARTKFNWSLSSTSECYL